MARRRRLTPPRIPQHIIQRGNNRQSCFAGDVDFAAYANWLHEAAEKYEVALHAWVLMSNHVHLLATPVTDDGISRMMQHIGRRYVRHFNRSHQRTGTLWEGRFKSCLIHADRYLLTCQRYIELNPVRAGMVKHPADYPWSSYPANGLNKPLRMWTAHRIWLDLGSTDEQRAENYRGLFDEQLEKEELRKIRQTVNTGLLLGDDRFLAEIERLTGCRVTAKKRGPRPRAGRGVQSEHVAP
ncbi:MAG: transposase [Gammaproteobacteria bacterium]|nr:transposase [Gammaproteobacteria bacterium]